MQPYAPPRPAGLRRALLVLAIPIFTACESGEPFEPDLLLDPIGAEHSQHRGGIGGAALLVGNFNFEPTDAVIRYDGRGRFLDVMVPDGRGGIYGPCCITVGPDQHVYASSPTDDFLTDGRVQRFHGLTGEYIDDFVPTGSGLLLPIGMVFHDGYLYVGDVVRSAILRYDGTTGAFVDVFIPDGSQGMAFGDPQHFVFGPDGNLYIGAEYTDRILRYNGTTGAFIDEFLPASAGFPSPGGIAFGPDGMLYAASHTLSEVRRFDITSGEGEVFVPAGSGGLSGPVGITFGPDGHFYATSLNTSEILRFDGRTGAFRGVFAAAGSGGLSGPRTLVFRATATMCHAAPGNPWQVGTVTVPYLTGLDHMAHGDELGACG